MKWQPTDSERTLVYLFSREHEVLQQQMERLKRLAYQNRLLNSKTAGEFRLAIALLEEKLREHQAWEEEHLFEAMKDSLGCSTHPVFVMTEEHQRLLGKLAKLRDEMGYSESDGRSTERLRVVTNTMNRLLDDHIHKEEKLLFPMAERMLSKERKAELIVAWEAKWS
ncbi:MAG: hemerythrin protein [Brevibacillus sp.]|nr:hemerythrin protein [Brevibacillus sp.]